MEEVAAVLKIKDPIDTNTRRSNISSLRIKYLILMCEVYRR